VYVVEKGDNGATVARQRAVSLGSIVGNDYVVERGLTPGEELVVSGIQKIGDGVPVSVSAPGNGSTAPPPDAR
jgi:multidrug efflux pump subunit AcrA (membrane-fusion protein)